MCMANVNLQQQKTDSHKISYCITNWCQNYKKEIKKKMPYCVAKVWQYNKNKNITNCHILWKIDDKRTKIKKEKNNTINRNEMHTKLSDFYFGLKFETSKYIGYNRDRANNNMRYIHKTNIW